MRTIEITEEYITLGQLLKLAGVADCGVGAKHMILEGRVTVNNEVEIRRGKKIRNGDIVEIDGKEKLVVSEKDKDKDKD